MRLGHALGARDIEVDDDAIQVAVKISLGEEQLVPRAPTPEAEAAVFKAEQLLNANPRPVYAYVGDLHPALGCVGLVFSSDWIRRVFQGATRCDSGGLIARKGAFETLPVDEVDDLLVNLSTPATCENDQWELSFLAEVDSSFENGRQGYVLGEAPNVDEWHGDCRATCILAAGDDCDRRTWTWEVRASAPPTVDELVALVLSPESRKRLDKLVHEGLSLPGNIRILSGYLTPGGVGWWFADPRVRDLLVGGDL